jgi:hypothetical protein
MKEYFSKVGSFAKWLTAAMAIDGYRRAVASDKINNVLVEIRNETELKIKKLEQMKSNLEIREDKVSWLNTKYVSVQGRIEKMLEDLNKNKKRLTEYNEDPDKNQTLIVEVQRNSEEIIERISTELTEFNNITNNKVNEIFKSLSDSDSTSKLVDNYWEQINSVLDNLSTLEKGAVAYILMSISIYYCILGIAISYYGDKLIIYFKLEDNYPWLVKWIKYRRTIQHYSIGINLLMVLTIVGYVAYVNILILFVY